ncbi:hypothetical protein CAC42_4328 [Sphaceloma murrayae]|uniref:PA14 domain-containing protein n=1 Tax=Sphaceloma murrayae TaxID=2082308 RepID=A0A2K1QLA1_9PEZI|nr:hypothetical protein CAC42_4328 [Sphaceloma murrayae]
MRVLAGLVPALAALTQIHAQSTTVALQPAEGQIDMQQVPDDKKNLQSIPATTINNPRPKQLAVGSSAWSSFSSEKSAERARTPVTTATTTTSTKKAASTTKKITKKTTTKKGAAKTTAKANKTTAKAKGKAKATSKKQKRQATATTIAAIGAAGTNQGCSINAQKVQGTYTPTPNTPQQFLADPLLYNTAADKWLPPAGYWTSFQNAVGQTVLTQNSRYILYYQVPTYDPTLCAVACDPRDECRGFNLYYSRSPVWEPLYRNATNPNGTCSNPVAVTEIGCGLYFDWIYAKDSVNYGQWRADFLLTTVGNNGYNKNTVPSRPTNYTQPKALIGAVNGFGAPEYIGYTYSTAAFDNDKCAAQCNTYTAQQKQYAIGNKTTTYEACNYFNAFNLTYQGTYQGSYCVLYNDTSVLSNGYMTYTQTVYNGVTYTYNLTNSFGTELYGKDYGTITPAWSAAPIGNAAACSALGGTGTTLLSIDRANYTIACGYDVKNAYDIGNATVSDYYSCFDACDGFTGCSGFAFLPYNTAAETGAGTCYFKSLSGVSVPPTVASIPAIGLAWLTSSYAGFNAGKKVQTITYTTYTTAWTGTTTATTTSFNDLTGYIIIQTPGLKTTSAATAAVPTVTQYTDSGTLASITSTTVGTTSGTVTIRTIYPTPACGSASYGASYAFYSNSYMGGQNTKSYPLYSPTVYKTKVPTATGITKYIAEDNTDTTSTTIYGRAVDGRSLVIQHTFYVYAGRGSGRYYFQIPYTDDIQFLWVGDYAVSGWNRTNNDLLQFWTGNPQTPVTAGFYLSANTWTPVRVHWANGGGAGDMQLSIIDPLGNYLAKSDAYANSGYLSPMINANVCTAGQAAAFPAWGRET